MASSRHFRKAAPSPGCRLSYQSRVSSASAAASGRKTTRRVTRDPSASFERDPTGSRTPGAERDPPNGGPIPPPHQTSSPGQPHVRLQTGSPTTPSRVRLARQRGVSGAPKVQGTWPIQYTGGSGVWPPTPAICFGVFASQVVGRIGLAWTCTATACVRRQRGAAAPTPAGK